MKAVDLNCRVRLVARSEGRTISWQTIWKRTNSKVVSLVSSRVTSPGRLDKKDKLVRVDNRAGNPDNRRRVVRARMRKRTKIWTGSAALPSRFKIACKNEVPAHGQDFVFAGIPKPLLTPLKTLSICDSFHEIIPFSPSRNPDHTHKEKACAWCTRAVVRSAHGLPTVVGGMFPRPHRPVGRFESCSHV